MYEPNYFTVMKTLNLNACIVEQMASSFIYIKEKSTFEECISFLNTVNPSSQLLYGS